MTAPVAVVGGGLAGISAALACADAGRPVTLFEARPQLGGLTHSFTRGELRVDNGQHVFLRCCTAYRALLDRLGVADRVTLQPRLEIPIRLPGATEPTWLRRDDLPAPLHLASSLLRYEPLRPLDRARFALAALALRRVDPKSDRTDRQSFGEWLRRHGQSAAAIEALWDLVGVATLNATADDASLSLAATVFQEGLLTDPAAADIGWSLVPLRELHGDPARDRLIEAGADVRVGTKVRAVGEGWQVSTDRGEETFSQVVLATPPPVTEQLAPAGAIGLPPGWSGGLGSSPIVNVHVVLDRKVLGEPFVAGVRTPVQWVFDRTRQSGLDSGQYLAMSLSAADAEIDLPTAKLRERLLPELLSLLPEARGARVLDFFVTRERHATFRPGPGTASLRPPARTALPGLYLAGAWTATGWPATMEGAARSGAAAAAALLQHNGKREGVGA
ncbi:MULTISPECIES: hydroxysqualene dehydroxylase HpnE [Amycolatopsis]|uniref:Hydroxysqualene dehydroxylase HpnE n=3 Tax=Amycolatopsis TaxID=1813 RepID=A0ABW5HZS3_9PSEU